MVDGTYDDAVRASAALAADDVLVVSDTSWEGYTEVPRTVIDGLRARSSPRSTSSSPTAPDVVVVPMGVGALAAAVVRALRVDARRSSRSNRSRPRAVCARPRPGIRSRCPARTTRSWPGSTAARCRRSRGPSVSAGVDVFVAVGDAAAEQAMRDLATVGIVAGETGAAALAGLRAVVERRRDRPARPPRARALHRRRDRPVAYHRIVGREP